jgi:glucose-6-phosphate 1-epimerase
MSLPIKLPKGITLTVGQGGQPMLAVRTPAAEADVYLHGGHLTHWQPAGREPVIFTSEQAVFDGEKAIRGGIPVCFPWFADAGSPGHGFARTAQWSIDFARFDGDDLLLGLMLRHDDNEVFARLWPHKFEASLHFRIGRSLTTTFGLRNVGDNVCAYEIALHTYFAVADVRQIEFAGFDGTTYVSKVEGQTVRQQGEPTIDGEVDRIYQDHSSPVTITDGNRRVRIIGENSRSTVLWNPHIEKAAQLSDLGNDEWPNFVCVETANIKPHAVAVEPGEWHAMSQTVEVENA